MQTNQVHQPTARHSSQQDSYDAENNHHIFFIFFLTQTNSTQSNAHPKQDESNDDQPIKLEVIFRSNTVIKPFTVMIKEFHTSSASFAMEAVII